MEFSYLVQLIKLLDEHGCPHPTHISPLIVGLLNTPDWTRMVLNWDKALDMDTIHATEKVLEAWQGWTWSKTMKSDFADGVASVYRRKTTNEQSVS